MEPYAAQPHPIERIRGWLRSDLKVLRWVLLGLYMALIIGLFGWVLLGIDDDLWGFLLTCLGIVFVTQAFFIFGSGTIQLCKPLRRRRLLLPLVASGAMFAMLALGLFLAMVELFRIEGQMSDEVLQASFFGVLLLSWLIWGVLLFVYARNWQRYQVMSRIARMLFAGSLLELLATVPSHVIVIRRPGCFVGILTMLGIIAGLNVMLFSFGPMLVVLFLRPRYRSEKALGTHFCAHCGYDLRASKDRCPECGTQFVQGPSQVSLDPSRP